MHDVAQIYPYLYRQSHGLPIPLMHPQMFYFGVPVRPVFLGSVGMSGMPVQAAQLGSSVPIQTAPSCPPCRQVLPSAQTAIKFRDDRPGKWADAARDTLERAGLVALGLALVGEREGIIKKSLAVSAVIELSVILLGMGSE